MYETLQIMENTLDTQAQLVSFPEFWTINSITFDTYTHLGYYTPKN